MNLFESFCNLVEDDGIEVFINLFRNPPETPVHLALDTTYIPQKDAISQTWYDDIREEDITSLNYFKDSLQGKFKGIRKDIETMIRNTQMMRQTDRFAYNKILEKSQVNFTKIRQSIKGRPALQPYLLEILYFISKIELIYRALHKNENISDTDICFSLKKVHSNKLKRIYNISLSSGYFIDKDKTSEDTFITILNSLDVHKEEGSIHFNCETKQAAYILEKLQPFFKNLTFEAIGKSKKFYSRQRGSKKGTLIKAGNISRGLHGRTIKESERIDAFFEQLNK